MTRSKTYTPELREEAVKLVLTQGLTLDDAAVRLTIPKGTLANWVAAARHGTSPKVMPLYISQSSSSRSAFNV